MSEHPITEQMLAAKNATGHSIFGPSSAHRWFICPRSLIADTSRATGRPVCRRGKRAHCSPRTG
jgi:hypothetical protein